MANKIYTIGREFGSGGREVGEKLAAKLGIKLYDKELLQQAAKDSGFCEEIFENHDEKPTNSFLYSLVMDTYSVSGYSAAPFLDMPLNHKVFLAQFETIHADLDVRIKNVSRNLNITENKARDIINKTDKQRASYYNYYTSKKWGDSKSYNLSLDAGKLGTDNCVEMILKFRELMDAMK